WRYSGSGLLLRDTSHILRSLHVVEGAGRVRVSFPSGESYACRVVAKDANNDLALVRLEGMRPRAEGFTVDPRTRIEVGEQVHALGYPLGPGLSRRPSIVSGQVNADTGPRDNIAQFRMTSRIQEGSSGGPVVNSKGLLVGIASSGFVRKGVVRARFGAKVSAASLILERARLVQRFDVRVERREKASYTPQEIFREFSPYVVLIETQ
ncbi:MAG: serine protease, partial [bacterium]